jgi:myo-inositol-1(or 4)-monophosphatase
MRKPESMTLLTKVALKAAKEGGGVLKKYWLGEIPNLRRFKGRNDLVTGADLASCEIIKKVLMAQFPSHSYLFEEKEFTELNGSDYLWIVDPLDGTTFHNRGLPYYSIIISLQYLGETLLGVVFSPMLEDFFITQRGKGSWQKNHRQKISRRLKVSKTRKLKEAVIGYSHGKSEAHARQMGQLISCLFPRCRSIISLGGADIGYVAAGSCDAFVDNSSTPWDFAALDLMIREAGGCSTDWKGDDWKLGSDCILLCNRFLQKALLEVLSQRMADSSE